MHMSAAAGEGCDNNDPKLLAGYLFHCPTMVGCIFVVVAVRALQLRHQPTFTVRSLKHGPLSLFESNQVFTIVFLLVFSLIMSVSSFVSVQGINEIEPCPCDRRGACRPSGGLIFFRNHTFRTPIKPQRRAELYRRRASS